MQRLFKSNAYLSVVIISTTGKTLKGIYKRELVVILFLKRYGFDISYTKRRNKTGVFIYKYPN